MTVTSLWVGATSPSGARVVAKVSGTNVELLVDEDPGFSAPARFGPVAADPQGVASITAAGLDKATRYFYALEVDGATDPGDPTGQFRTHPADVGDPASFTVAAFGDAGLNPTSPGQGAVLAPDRISNHPTFDTVRQADPLLVFHMGDLTYYDLGSGQHGITGGASLANYRRMYEDVLLQPRQHELYRDVATAYVWDDHCYGPNNSDGTHAGKGNAAAAYRERVPHHPLAETTGPIYHAFEVGRVLFICSDVRFNRSPNGDPDDASKTMLGQGQKDWMDTLLATSAAELLVWVGAGQWIGTSNDSWGNFTTERSELVTMFGDRGWIGRMCFVGADMHALAIDDGSAAAGGGIPVFQFAGIDASFLGQTFGQYSHGGSGGRQRYGILEIRDQGGAGRVTGTGWIGSGSWNSYQFYSQQPVAESGLLALDYTDVNPPFEPTEDDQAVRNDVTAERDGGSSARVVQESGPLSVQDPPAGVGRYDEQVTLNVDSDDDLGDQAGWRVHRGTVDEPRYPQVTLQLARPDIDALRPAVAAVESGDRFTIDNPPVWLPRGDVELIAEGFDEKIGSHVWEWHAATSPAAPWTVAVADSRELGRLDTVGSELLMAVDAAQTLISIEHTGAAWITDALRPAEFPFDVVAGGELLRVDGCADTGSVTQDMTVQRSVNGVVKAHAAGTPLQLAQPAVIAL